METQTEQTGMMISQYFGAPSLTSSEIIIEDKGLRKSLIEAAMKAEDFIKKGAIPISHKFVSKPNEWGLMIETSMEQLRPNKPIVYKFHYTLDMVAYNTWLEEHKYLLGNEGALVFTSNRGIKIIIMPQQPLKPIAQIVIRYGEDGNDTEHNSELPLKSLRFIVHREVINEHDWIVKCVIE